MKKSKSRGNLEDFYDLNIYKKDPSKNIPVQNKHTKSLSSILKVNDLTLEIDNKKILEKCRVEYKNAWLLKDDASINRFIDHHLDDHLQAFMPTKKKFEQSKEGDDLIDMLEVEIDQKYASIQIGNKNVDGNHKIGKEFENLFISTKDFINRSQLQKATKDPHSSTMNKNRVKQYLINKKVYNITRTHTNIHLLKDSPDIILFKIYMLQNVLDQYCLKNLLHSGFQFERIITTTNNTTNNTITNSTTSTTITEKNSAESIVIGLELIDFQLTDDKGICLSSAFAYCPMLKQINISNNQFEDHSIHLILQSIFTYTKCELLNISKNNLGHSSISYLTNYLSTITMKQPPSSSHSVMLQELDVSSCNLKDKYCEMLCESLHHNQTLFVLKIANNNFMLIKDQSDYINHSDNDENDDSDESEVDNEHINVFADIGLAINNLILTNHTLVDLDISSNQLSQHTMQSLCINIAKNRTLQRLNLSNIEFTDALAGQLGLSLHRNQHLRVIDLSNNQIHSKGAITIAYAAQLKHSALTNIYLKGNPICSKGCKYLFRTMHVVASKASAKSHTPLSTTTTQYDNNDHVSSGSKDDEVKNRQLIIDYDIINPTSMHTTYDISPDSNVVYDLNLDMHGIYELTLSDPYEYTVARIIQDIAEIHPMLNLKVVKHLASSNRTCVNNSNNSSNIDNKNNNHNNISQVTKSKTLSSNTIKSNNYPAELWEFIYLHRNILVTNKNDNDSTIKEGNTISKDITILQQYQLESSERVWDHCITRMQSAIDTLRYVNEVKQQKRMHDHQDNTITDITNPINTINTTIASGKKKHWLVNIPKPMCLADHMSTIDKNMKLSTQLKILKSNALEKIMNVFKKLNINFEQEELLKDIVQQLISCSKYDETISYSRLLNILFSSVLNHFNDCRISFQHDTLMKQQHQLSNECMSFDVLQVYKKLFGIYLGSEFLPFLSFSDMVVRIISESDIYETGSGSLSRDRYMKWMLQQQMNLVPVMTTSFWSLPSLQQLHTTNNNNNNVGVNNNIMAAKWMIPSHGILHLHVECTLFPDSHSANILTDKAFLTLLFSSSSLTEYNTSVLDHILIILQEMSNELHITCEQAEILLSMVLEYQQQHLSRATTKQQQQQQTESHHRYSHFYLVERLSYQLISSMEVQRFLVRNLKFPEILKLRKQMGYMFLVLTGNVTGHYILHLDNSFHREVAIRLGKLSNYEKYLKLSSINSIKDLFLKQNTMMQEQINEDMQQHNIKNIVLNTSQCSSGECFRNASFNQKFIKLSSEWFQKPLPSIGILRFDFISYQKPSSYIEELYANHIQPIGLKINDSISDKYDYSTNTDIIFTNSYGNNNSNYSNNVLTNNKADGEVMSVDVLLDILFDKKVIKRKTFMRSRLHGPIIPTNRKSAFVKRFKNVISISKLNTIHVTHSKMNTDHSQNQNNGIVRINEDVDSDSDSDNSHDTTVEDSTAAATAVADDRITLSQEDLVLQWSDFAYTSFKTYRYMYLEVLKKRFNLALKEECAKPVVGYINRLAPGEIPPLTYQHESYLHIRNLPFYQAISLSSTTTILHHANIMSSYRNTIAANHSDRDLGGVHTHHSNINNNAINTSNNITSTVYSNINSEEVMNDTTFEVFFQRLEVVLLYQTWFTIPQVKNILQYLYEKKNASVRVLTRCLCILYNRIIHHENLYELFQIYNHNNNISTTMPHRTTTSTVAGSTGLSSPTRLKSISKTNSNKLNIRSISPKKLSTIIHNEQTLISTNSILHNINSNNNHNNSKMPSYHELLAHDSSFYTEVIHRLGVLNVINLNQPEGRYELDLASIEDRNTVKLLAILAVIFKTYKWTNVIFYKESMITPPVILTTLLLKYINTLPFNDYITTHNRNNNNNNNYTTITNIGMSNNNNNKSHMEYINNITIQNKTLPRIYNPPIQWCKEDPDGPPKYGHLHFTITK